MAEPVPFRLNMSSKGGVPHLANIAIEFKEKTNPKFKEKNLTFIRTHLIPALNAAGLLSKVFYGTVVDGKRSIFLHVYATHDRLLDEAAHTSWRLKLDPVLLKDADIAENTRLAREGFEWDPAAQVGSRRRLSPTSPKQAATTLDLSIPQHPEGCARGADPYDHIFAPYSSDKKTLFQLHSDTNSPLRQGDALQLLRAIIEAPRDIRGAGLNLDRLVTTGRAERWLPSHEQAGQEVLSRAWLSGMGLSFFQPVNTITAYLGERVGFHFALLSHLNTWLILPALVGAAIFVHQIVYGAPGVGYLPAYGVFTAIWATLTLEFWKRHQSRLALIWGMSEWRETEPLRAEYVAHPSTHKTRSYVDGKPTYWSSPTLYRARMTGSSMIMLTCLGCVVAVVVSIFILRVTLLAQEKSRGGSIPDGYGNHLTSLMNAIQVNLLNYVYSKLARVLTAWENHPTESSYENSLVVKLALFYAINAYFPLLWIAAIKNYVSIYGQSQACALNAAGSPDCFPELQTQLGIMIVTRIVISNVVEYVLPLAWPWIVGMRLSVRSLSASEVQAATNEEMDCSPTQRDCSKASYDVFEDYLELLIAYGYTVLFVVAFPLAPLLVLVANAVEVRLDAWKILRLYSRPVPKGAASIGAWQACFTWLTYAAVITNTTVCVFTDVSSIFGRSLTLVERLIFFVVAEHVVLGLKFGIAEYIPDTPYDVSLQLERGKYLTAKHCMGVKDMANRDVAVLDDEVDEDGTGSSEGGSKEEVVGTGLGAAVNTDGLLVYDSFWESQGLPIPSRERARVSRAGTEAGVAHVPQPHAVAVPVSLPPASAGFSVPYHPPTAPSVPGIGSQGSQV